MHGISINTVQTPRMLNDTVFRDAISKGVESQDFFGFAAGKDADRYLGFAFGKMTSCMIDESSLLIDREESLAYKERTKSTPVTPVNSDTAPSGETNESSTAISPVKETTLSPASSGASPIKNQFYGTISLNPVKEKMDFATIMDEVVQHFTSKFGVSVQINIEIQTNSKDGFDQDLQRTIKENCNVLKFNSAEFEEE